MDEISAIVRERDIDRYLATLLAPDSRRAPLMALYAFRAELARIAGQVSEPRLAEIRLQFWLDTLEGIYAGEPQAHPVAKGLALAIDAGGLPKSALQGLARAYQFTFYSDPLPTTNDLEGWLGETEAAVITLATMILDQSAAHRAGAAAGLAGVAYGLMRLFNNLPQAIALKQNFLPTNLLAAQGLDASLVASGTGVPGLENALASLLSLAEKRLAEARDLRGTPEGQVFPAFLHVGLTQAYVARAKALGLGVLQKGCDISQLRKQWLLWKAHRRQLF